MFKGPPVTEEGKERPGTPARKIRLQKYLASAGVASRRASEELIRQRRVKVNGKVVSDQGFQVRERGDKIEVDGKVVRPAPKGIVLLNKPRHVISTLSDPEGRPCLSRYITKHSKGYFPVGRLDWESEGLVILTNDGELADLLLHPRYELPREYRVVVEGYVHDKIKGRLTGGVRLDDGPAKAKVEILARNQESSDLILTISEGRNRLIRRMMDKVGHPVLQLIRLSHGPFKLGRIQIGQVRRLTEEEYSRLRQRTFQLAAERPDDRAEQGSHFEEE